MVQKPKTLKALTLQPIQSTDFLSWWSADTDADSDASRQALYNIVIMLYK